MERGKVVLVVVLLANLAGCGGSLAPSNGAGGNGGAVAACETPIPLQSVAGMPCTFPIPAPPCDVVSTSHIAVDPALTVACTIASPWIR